MSRSDGHPTDAELQEWIDGALSVEEAPRVADHVATCRACAAEAEALRELLESIESLPRRMPPPEQVREGARRRIEGPDVLPIESVRGIRARRLGLAAAAIALVLIGAAAGVLLGPARKQVASGPADAGGAVFHAVAADYDRAVAELEAALEMRREELDPATVRIVEENLRVVDRAIREARAALAADPGNPVLRELVAQGYAQKLDLLRRATGPSETL